MMDDPILRTLIIFFIIFGVCMLINTILSLREKKTEVWKRTLGWIMVIPTFIIAAYFGGVIFLLAVMLLVSLAVEEFYFLAGRCDIGAYRITGTIFSTLLPLVAFLGGSEIFHIMVVLFALAILVLPIYKRQIRKDLSTDIQTSSATILGMFYVGWTSSYLILIRSMGNGFNYFLFFFLLIIATDTSSYYFGKFLGKTKVFNFISPGKSLQGYLGGVAIALLFAYVIRYLLPIAELRVILLFGALIAVSGQLGDLVESSLKREANVKDAGRILPGFGGILDRFDSLIFASPIVYFFLVLLTS
jgi:phosphatidate cytidylyltransferase